MDQRSRHQLAHYGAPAAFLAAVTIAVILVKAGLNGGSESTTTAALPTTSTATKAATTTTKLVLTGPAASTTTTTAAETTTPGAAYYVVESGDTLGSIAEKHSTTVDELMTLNPGIDPTALRIGQRIRVK